MPRPVRPNIIVVRHFGEELSRLVPVAADGSRPETRRMEEIVSQCVGNTVAGELNARIRRPA
jgi:hypothetical protein